MDRATLIQQIKAKKSFLCVGLDPNISQFPKVVIEEAADMGSDPMLIFNKAIVEATHDLCVAYKPNLAFYECRGVQGWQTLEATLELIPENIFVIADAKRGDIGNTSRMYAQTFFETYNFDGVTVAPYMGEDSVTPFISKPGKWVIVLGLTSNPGANDYQMLVTGEGRQLFEEVILKTQQWGTPDNLMFVVGATRGEMIGKVRELAPNHFFLVPGVGKQGGSLEEVARFGLNQDCGLLVNSSRGIIHASTDGDFAQRAREEAMKLQSQMEKYLRIAGVI